MRRGSRLDDLLSGLAGPSAGQLAQHFPSDDQSHVDVGWSLTVSAVEADPSAGRRLTGRRRSTVDYSGSELHGRRVDPRR
jgi:hypothetical protein